MPGAGTGPLWSGAGRGDVDSRFRGNDRGEARAPTRGAPTGLAVAYLMGGSEHTQDHWIPASAGMTILQRFQGGRR